VDLLLGTIDFDVFDRCDAHDLALPIFLEDRPPMGLAGLADWRLHGLVSNWIARRFIEPREAKPVLYGGDSRLSFDRIFIQPMGSMADIKAADLARRNEEFASVISLAGVHDLACPVPGLGAEGIEDEYALEQWLATLEIHLENPRVTLFLPGHLLEIASGKGQSAGWNTELISMEKENGSY